MEIQSFFPVLQVAWKETWLLVTDRTSYWGATMNIDSQKSYTPLKGMCPLSFVFYCNL